MIATQAAEVSPSRPQCLFRAVALLAGHLSRPGAGGSQSGQFLGALWQHPEVDGAVRFA